MFHPAVSIIHPLVGADRKTAGVYDKSIFALPLIRYSACLELMQFDEKRIRSWQHDWQKLITFYKSIGRQATMSYPQSVVMRVFGAIFG